MIRYCLSQLVACPFVGSEDACVSGQVQRQAVEHFSVSTVPILLSSDAATVPLNSATLF